MADLRTLIAHFRECDPAPSADLFGALLDAAEAADRCIRDAERWEIAKRGDYRPRDHIQIECRDSRKAWGEARTRLTEVMEANRG